MAKKTRPGKSGQGSTPVHATDVTASRGMQWGDAQPVSGTGRDGFDGRGQNTTTGHITHIGGPSVGRVWTPSSWLNEREPPNVIGGVDGQLCGAYRPT